MFTFAEVHSTTTAALLTTTFDYVTIAWLVPQTDRPHVITIPYHGFGSINAKESKTSAAAASDKPVPKVGHFYYIPFHQQQIELVWTVDDKGVGSGGGLRPMNNVGRCCCWGGCFEIRWQ